MNILTNSIQDKNEFAKFIRDLSSNLTNIKYLLEDYENSKKEELKDKKKKKILKKKDIIIEQNIEKKRKELVKEDFKKVEYYLNHMSETDENNPYEMTIQVLLHTLQLTFVGSFEGEPLGTDVGI